MDEASKLLYDLDNLLVNVKPANSSTKAAVTQPPNPRDSYAVLLDDLDAFTQGLAKPTSTAAISNTTTPVTSVSDITVPEYQYEDFMNDGRKLERELRNSLEVQALKLLQQEDGNSTHQQEYKELISEFVTYESEYEPQNYRVSMIRLKENQISGPTALSSKGTASGSSFKDNSRSTARFDTTMMKNLMNELRYLIQELDKPTPIAFATDLEHYMTNFVASGKQLLLLNIPPPEEDINTKNTREFVPQTFVQEAKRFVHKCLNGVPLIQTENERKTILRVLKKSLQTCVELFEAYMQSRTTEALARCHSRVKIDITKVLTTVRDVVRKQSPENSIDKSNEQAQPEVVARRKESWSIKVKQLSEVKAPDVPKAPATRPRLLSAHRSDSRKAETVKFADIVEDLKLTKTILKSSSQPPEEADFSAISEVVSKAANDTVNILSKLTNFQFNAFKSNIITIIQNIKRVALAQGDKVNAEHLLDLGIQYTETSNQLYTAVSTIPLNNNNVNNLRKEYLDSLSTLLMTLKENFKTRCSKCNGVIVGPYYKTDGCSICTICFVCVVCKVPLTTFCEKDGIFYCQEHFMTVNLPKCHKCNQPVSTFLNCLLLHRQRLLEATCKQMVKIGTQNVSSASIATKT